MTGELIAISLTVVAHWVGAAILVWHLWRCGAPDEDSQGGQGGDWYDGEAWHPRPVPPSGGIPLPDAEPAARRLRDEHDRVADPRRRPARRSPDPARQPSSPVSSSPSSSSSSA